MFTVNIQHGVGVAPAPQESRMYARGRSFFVGEVAALDLNRTFAQNNEVGSHVGGMSIARLVQAGDLRSGFFGVWLDDVADQIKGRFTLQGEVRAYVQFPGAVGAGTVLYAAEGQTHLSPTAPVGTKAVGFLLDPIPDASTRVLARVALSGVNGFGGRIT